MTRTLPRHFAPRVIPDLLIERARTRGSATAVHGFADGYPVWLEYQALLEQAQGLAGLLSRECGLTKSDHVVWMLDNSDGIHALVLAHAALLLGVVNVPLNPRLSDAEVAEIVDRVQPGAVITGAGSESYATSSAVSLAEAAVRSEPPSTRTALDPSDPVVVIFTSGTTGRPRGVVHSHESCIAAAMGWSDTYRLRETDVFQSPFPIFSGAGLHGNALAALWAGATNVIDVPDVDDGMKLAASLGTTVFAAVPSIYQFWLDSSTLDEIDLGTLRLLVYGGASMPPSVIEKLQSRLPGVGLLQTYGLTEAGPGGLFLAEEYVLDKLGSIGNRGVGAFTSFRVVNDAGTDVGSDEVGELLLKGPSVMIGYLSDPAATREAVDEEGWLRTGDLVRADKEGFLYHVDRRKDVIIRGGFNIGSAEVEAALVSHRAVLDAAVVARPHSRLGEEVHAFVVPAAGARLNLDEIREHCEALLADYKVPRYIEIADDLPRTASGKVRKALLRDQIATGGDGQAKEDA